MRGLDWQVLQLSLGAGLLQRADDRARQPPYLDICRDVQFDELGGLQTRYPFSDLVATANARRIYEYDGQLILFTKDALYTYFEDQDTLVQGHTYLAVKPTETPRHISTNNQWDGDTARLSGMVAHAWEEDDDIWIALSDETTGAVTLSPVSVADGIKPRLVALSTKILLFYETIAGALVVAPISPTDAPEDIPGNITGSVTTVLAAASFNSYYDVCRILGTDNAAFACRRDVTTSYTVGIVTSGLVVTSATPARACTHAIALASHPLGTHLQIVRSNGTAVVGDYIQVSGISDVTINQALGTTPNAVSNATAAYRSVAVSGSVYRCHAFWTDSWGSADSELVERNTVDTDGTIGTESTWARRQRLCSRAFDHDGRVFVFTGFFGESSFTGAEETQLQNTFFLYRDDGLLCGKHVATRAASQHFADTPLSGVQNIATNTYVWGTGQRRIVPIGSGGYTAYSDINLVDVTVEFDSNEARRVAVLGRTLYISGAEILQYDGVRLNEVGFHIYPYRFAGAEAASGSISANGTYAAKATWRHDNAKGERDRSTTATIAEITIATQPAGITFAAIGPLTPTHRTQTPNLAACEIWRTTLNPLADDPFFLVTSQDPDNTGVSNGYVPNVPTSASLSFTDEASDTNIGNNEGHYENGGILENIAPPGATIVLASDTRLFLAGVAGDPDRVWYSKVRGDNEIAAFHEALVADVPRAGGDITALALLSETLVVFRESAIYALPGSGFGNFGGADGSQNFGPARLISLDCGAVSHEAVAVADAGLIFKSSKGWYLLNRGFSLEYIGAPIADYDSETVHAINVLTAQHQIRILTSGRMLVFDTYAKQWGEWTISDGVHACLWRGAHMYLTTTAIKQQQSTYTGLTYGIDIETTWIKPADLQGEARVRWLMVLGEYRSAHDLRLRTAFDYSSSYTDDRTWTVSPTTVGGPEQVRLGPSRQRCQAFKLRITAQAVGSASPPSGEALKLTGLAVELGLKRGINKRLPVAQKT